MSEPAITVVFDLDGTLVATADDLLDSLNHVLAHAGLAPLAADQVGYRFGQGARTMISHGHEVQGCDLGKERLRELTTLFIEHYSDNIPGKSAPFPGLIEALDRLESAGMRLAVCTNKLEKLARLLLDRLRLLDRFAALAGADTFSVRKPEADHILKTVAAAGGAPGRAVMVGDSVSDILGARNARIPSIAVPFGYSDIPVEELEPDHIITGYHELGPDLIEELLRVNC